MELQCEIYVKMELAQEHEGSGIEAPGVPTSPLLQERGEILRTHAKLLPLACGVDFDTLAAGCVGCTGADLAAVCRQAAMRALTSGDMIQSR